MGSSSTPAFGSVYITIGGTPNGNWALMKGYPTAGDWVYKVPTYTLTLSVMENGKLVPKDNFDVIRFGVNCNPENEEDDGEAE